MGHIEVIAVTEDFWLSVVTEANADETRRAHEFAKDGAETAVRDIRRRNAQAIFGCREDLRIVLSGLRGKDLWQLLLSDSKAFRRKATRIAP